MQLVCEKDFGWMALWELNPEVLADGLCDFGGKSLRHKASMTVEDGPRPFRIIPWYQPYNSGKPWKTSVRVAESLETTRCAALAVFLGTALAGLLRISPPRWLQSAHGRHKCLPSCWTKGFDCASRPLTLPRQNLTYRQAEALKNTKKTLRFSFSP
jgi:hypothetical protein